MNAVDLIVLALAAARLTRIVTLDGIFAPVRRFIDYRWPGEETTFADSEVVVNGTDTLGNTIGYLRKTKVDLFKSGDIWYATTPRWAGNLISCPWCTSVWVSVGVLVLAVTMSEWIWYPFYVLAIAEVAGVICSRTT